MKPIVRWLLVAAVIAAAWVGYRAGEDRLFSRGPWVVAAAGVQVPDGWQVYDDPAGFQVALPADWDARADGASGRAVISGPGGEQVVVWPVFLEGARGGAADAPAAAIVEQLSRKVHPDASWGAPRSTGKSAAVQHGAAGGRRLAASFASVSSPRGQAGMFYCVAAPPDTFDVQREMLAKILESFHVRGSQAGGQAQAQAPAAPRYVLWSDPNEGAFRLEVPADWRAEGGAFRFAPVDVRPAVAVTSPDNQIRITAGDKSIPPFTVPSQALTFAGFPEGSWYSPGYGVQMLVRRFEPGAAFAAGHVRDQVSRLCNGMQIDESRDRPDAVEAINRIQRQYGGYVSVESTAGEVTFGCAGQSGPMRGYFYATTQLTATPAGGLWHVPYLYGYLAAQDREAEAQQVMAHAIASYEINPQWAAMQQGVAANTSAIVTDTNRAITQIIRETFENTQRVNDEIGRRGANARRGVVEVIDETTGEQFEVESGSNYYWIDHRGNIVGTDVYTQPTIDFRAMLQLP